MMRISIALAVILVTMNLATFDGSPFNQAQTPEKGSPTTPVADRQSAEHLITPKCRQSIDRGTDWLLSAIHRHGVGVDINQPTDLSCTAITGLALLAQGSTPAGGPHSTELRQILDAVLLRVEPLSVESPPDTVNTLVQRKIGANADLFLAAIFLSQIHGDAGRDERYVRPALEKLVRIIGRTQGPDGTWGNQSWAPILGTVLGWESLRAASSCGMRIDASAELAGKALLDKLKDPSESEADWMHSFYKKASSVRVLHSLGYRDNPTFEESVQRIITVAREDYRPFVQAGGEEYLAFFLVTECLLQEPRPSWTTWYPTVRDKLIRVQNSDGSWSGHHCITSRTFCTAAALLTLQAPNRYLVLSDL